MVLVDTHAHLTDAKFDGDREAIIDRSVGAGIGAVISIGEDIASSQRAVELASSHPSVFATVGVHPHNASQWGVEAEASLRELLSARRDARIVAVGETGLDYHYDFSPREQQAEALRAQLRLAKEHGLPVVLHCREAADDLLSVLEQEQDSSLRGVLHCFAEDLPAAERALALGFHLGIGGLVTFKNAEGLRDVIRAVGLERVVVETDAPHMAPVPHRGKRNEPALVAHIAHFLAELLSLSEAEVTEITTRNALSLFGLPPTLLNG
ncbi:TatD family hydrolase [Candidatus Sumerlaeota bacterium]|nr:TatD family hydrolase [Candidatus Sumerlaeota bacterium]